MPSAASGRPWLGDEAGQRGLAACRHGTPGLLGLLSQMHGYFCWCEEGELAAELPSPNLFLSFHQKRSDISSPPGLPLPFVRWETVFAGTQPPPAFCPRVWLDPALFPRFCWRGAGQTPQGTREGGTTLGSPSPSPVGAPPRRSPRRGCHQQAEGMRGPDAAGGEGQACGDAQRRWGRLLAGWPASSAVFWLLREPFWLADLSPPPPSPPHPPRYLGCPWEEMGEGPSSLLRGGRTPKMAAIEQGWIWPNNPNASAWQDQCRFLVYKMLYWDFCMWWQVLLMLLWATEAEVTY